MFITTFCTIGLAEIAWYLGSFNSLDAGNSFLYLDVFTGDHPRDSSFSPVYSAGRNRNGSRACQ
jgi:hypothetical protein